jgi:hypothetical protein
VSGGARRRDQRVGIVFCRSMRDLLPSMKVPITMALGIGYIRKNFKNIGNHSKKIGENRCESNIVASKKCNSKWRIL